MKFKNLFPRERIIIFVILIASAVLLSKLFLLQIVHSESYIEKADRQYLTPSTNIFERGTIYFSRKDGELVSAAIQNTGYKLAVNPNIVSVNSAEVYKKLSSIILLDEKSFLEKANKKNDPYEEIANRLNKKEADAISELKISGVHLSREKWRFYPANELSAQTLGLVGYKGDELGGRYGLEREYEDVLTRKEDNTYNNFFAEVFSGLSETLFSDEKKNGDIVTTIEPIVQGLIEKTLSEVKEKYRVDSIGGIIMDPKTGAIYAMATLPSFDPNNFSKTGSNDVYGNPLVENVLEFGSVIKPLVVAAGLDTGVIKADTKYDDKGSVWVEKKEIFNFDKKARGVVTMQEVLNQSLNTGMVFIYKKLGKNNIRDYLLSYGIKEKTNIDLPNETSGLVSNLNSPRDIEYANASFGQGIALTPVELIRALASLSNDGILVTPHLVDRIRYEGGREEKLQYPTVKSKISLETSEEISRMLVGVMDQALKSGNAKLDRYSIAVKTGTAQVADNKNGGYYKDRHTHSFFGYFPAYDPKFIILLYATNPKGSPYASTTWADPFMSMAKFLINYYDVPPDR
ncbi:MAG: penicillin-binding protein 2 [Candidatus Pacebacteria bacterium]|nr:penicillin-binding protein 2 [Candidatus Paceibacterota bacterium]MCF7863033.1 penicillin-binding protein 2 [Candidatus Paceibacterota bacterium]